MSVEALFIDGPFDRTRKVLEEAKDSVSFAQLDLQPQWIEDEPGAPVGTAREVRYYRVYGPPTPSDTVLYVWRPGPDDDVYSVRVRR